MRDYFVWHDQALMPYFVNSITITVTKKNTNITKIAINY